MPVYKYIGRSTSGEEIRGELEADSRNDAQAQLHKKTVHIVSLHPVKAKFDIPGRFVWHCHIVEHEDNEMMRPYDVV